MLPENCSHPLRATRLYASLRRLLTVSAASGPPTRAFFISGRAVRSICLPSVGIAENLPPLPGSCALFARGTLWTDPHTASSFPPVATKSKSIETTSDDDFHPARKLVAGPPSVCRQVSSIIRDAVSSNCGQPALSVVVPC